MSEFRLIHKVGQVSLETLVKNAAIQGFSLVGSPVLISNVPTQLMVHTGSISEDPGYLLIEKTGQSKFTRQLEKLLDSGWKIYGNMLAGDVPVQAMIYGDISVFEETAVNLDTLSMDLANINARIDKMSQIMAHLVDQPIS